MKTAIRLALLLLGLASALPLQAQLEVPSYERRQPFYFCGGVPQGDRLSVPFDLINRGTRAIVIDSAIAVGDTADFYANHLVGSDDRYLNPLMWKHINGRTIEGLGASFNTFFFTPKSPGTKQLTITVYYHDPFGVPLTAHATVRFHTVDAPIGLGFLYTMADTVYTGDTNTVSAVTYDRTVVADTLTVRDTVVLGDTVFAAITGEKRIDLTSCGGVTITSITVEQEATDDIFVLRQPVTPLAIASGDSSLVDFLYVPLSTETAGRAVYVTFITAEGHRAVLRLIVVAYPKSAVESDPLTPGDGVIRDERGTITILRQGLESAPNPFNERTTLRMTAVRAGHARLSIVNTLGQEVATLLDDRVEIGTREIQFDAARLPAGFYFARLELAGDVVTKRLVLTR